MKNTETQDKHTPSHRTLFISLGVIVTLLLLSAAAALGWYTHVLNSYEGKFFAGVHVNGVDLSGMTYLEAVEYFDSQLATVEEEGIVVFFAPAVQESDTTEEDFLPSVTIVPTLPAPTVDAVEQLVFTYDSKTALDAAFAIGRDGSPLSNAREQWIAYSDTADTSIEHTYQDDAIRELLTAEFAEYESPAEDANIEINDAGDVVAVGEELGQAFDYEKILSDVETQLLAFDTTPMEIELVTDYPETTVDDIQSELSRIESYLENTPIVLAWEEQNWEYDRASVGSWLSIENGELSIDTEKLEEALVEPHEEIEVEVQEARWQVEKDDGGNLTGLSELQPAEEGRAINFEETAEDILAYLSGENSENTIAIAIEVTEPKFTPENVDELGITDILGTGYSNMAGSPVNRQHNIRRGVELLNGLLVAPEEEFCLNPALKPYTIEHGYRAELVIAGTETRPEIGGGLCQVGTTSFRAALSSGLDITSRQNHSYQVSYYNDPRNGNPGTDATIYDPYPDFCFYNDTPGYLLMQTRLDGTALYFDYWGSDDGREASYTEPIAYDWKEPPPTKEIETTDLAPGERRCTESAHKGVTAEFDYHIDYADGTTHDENFKSVYKPWQAVCQVGVEKKEETTEPPKSDTAEEKDSTAQEDTKKKKENSSDKKKKD